MPPSYLPLSLLLTKRPILPLLPSSRPLTQRGRTKHGVQRAQARPPPQKRKKERKKEKTDTKPVRDWDQTGPSSTGSCSGGARFPCQNLPPEPACPPVNSAVLSTPKLVVLKTTSPSGEFSCSGKRSCLLLPIFLEKLLCPRLELPPVVLRTLRRARTTRPAGRHAAKIAIQTSA